MAMAPTAPTKTAQPSIYGNIPPATATAPKPSYRPLNAAGAVPQAPGVPPQPGQAPGTFSASSNQINSTINPTASPELSHYRSLVGTAAENVATLPDRYQTAQSQFDNFAKSTAPQYQADLADATKLATANGTLGSGMLGDRYGSIANQRALALDTQRNSFLTDAINGSIDDRYRSLGALDTVAGDTAQQEAAARGEQRQERGYQYGTSQDATQNAMQQYEAEQRAQNQNFQQGVQLDQLGTQKTQNAQNAYTTASNSYGADAGSDFGALGTSLSQSQIQQILASLGQGGAPPGTTPNSGTYRPVMPTVPTSKIPQVNY